MVVGASGARAGLKLPWLALATESTFLRVLMMDLFLFEEDGLLLEEKCNRCEQKLGALNCPGHGENVYIMVFQEFSG